MKPRHQRLLLTVLALVLLGAAAALTLHALRDNIVFFHTPSEVVTGKVPAGRTVRLGGLVVAGSLVRAADGRSVRFAITDTARHVSVIYPGTLPDLFREARGTVVEGKLRPDGVFVASQVLARHDENYLPPAAQNAVDRATATTLK